MTPEFDHFCESIIREYLTPASKRNEHKSRYLGDWKAPTSKVRKLRSSGNRMSASQKTKVLKQQQYVGDFWKRDGSRRRNESEKSFALAGIAKGLGNHVKFDGVNPKTPGAKINSKQGDMEVKYVLPNGLTKVGNTGKTEYSTTNFKHHKPKD